MENTNTVNLSLKAFWHLIGKGDARDGKPAQFSPKPLQWQRYDKQERIDAAAGYAEGYAAGLPE